MHIERRTPQNTAIVLVDPLTSFATLFRSQPIEENVNGTVALAKTALGYGVPLVVTAPPESPRAGLYPALAEALGDHPVNRRARFYDAFDDEGFEAAVEATGRKHLVVAGLMTEGCVLFTALGALRRDYTVSLVVDACAGESEVTHQAAISRLTQLGVTPVTWFSFATELQRTYGHVETIDVYYDVMRHSPVFASSLGAQPVDYDLANQPTAIMETRLVHDVHRKASSLLAEAAARPGAPAGALRELRDFLVTTLQCHHTSEDERLWPLVLSLVPDVADALGALTEEHEQLEAALTSLEKAEITGGARHSDLADAAADVRDLVHRHLRHEEPVLFPALRDHVTAKQWAEFADYVRNTDTTVGPHLTVGFIDLIATPRDAGLFFSALPAQVRDETLPAMRRQAHATLDLLAARD
jgi:nicotinamidase-related amidase/hemerythrin-like domain-containing protein